MKLLNWMLCKFGFCSGHVEHIKDKNGVWWIGMRCQNTGTFHSPILSKFQDGGTTITTNKDKQDEK